MIRIILIGVLCCALWAASCKKEEEPLDTYVLQGTVTEKGTGAAIANAKIRVEAYHFTGVIDSEEEVGVTYSDTNGFYTIRPKIPVRISFDTIGRNSIWIHVTKDGFNYTYEKIGYALLKRRDTVYTASFQLYK